MLFLLLSLLAGSSEEIPPPVWPAYSQVGAYFGDYRQGMVLAYFSPIKRYHDGLTFLQTAGVRERHQTGFSTGLGYRRLVTSRLAVGSYAFIDYSQSDHRGRHLQGSVGGEILLRRFELHLNGYLPWGHQKRLAHCQEAYYGSDLLLGRNFEGTRQRLRLFGGCYWFFKSHCQDIVGPIVRVQFERDDLLERCRSRFILAGEAHYDQVRGWEGACWIALRFPLGRYKRGLCTPIEPICRLMGDPAMRQLAPVTASKT